MDDYSLDFLLVIRVVELDQRSKVIQVTDVLDVVDLVAVVLHRWLHLYASKLRDFSEEVFTLLLLQLELAVLDI